jgi:hypothetical protein
LIDTIYFPRYLDEILVDGGRIPIEEAPRILSEMGINPTGRYFAWYFLREFWEDLYVK